MEFYCCAVCAPGLVRSENQDNLFVNGAFRGDVSDVSVFRFRHEARNLGLYAVADGMGGEMHGELASLFIVRAMGGIDISGGCQGVLRYLSDRNAEICDLIVEHGGARIGSTFAGLCLNGRRADIVNIGDSRVYFLRGKVFSQVSRDHTSVQQMVDLGFVSREEARFHPDRHKLTQHMGIFPSEMVIEPFSVHFSVRRGDVFLLCSDGLTDMVDDYAIESVLKSSGSIEDKVGVLYEAALSNGGRDNITILLVEAGKRR